MFGIRGAEQEPAAGEGGAYVHQTAMAELTSAIHEQDLAALAALTPAGRAEQRAARWALFEHFDRMWDAAKDTDPHAGESPDYDGITAMRDLAQMLNTNVSQAQKAAGDEADGTARPRRH